MRISGPCPIPERPADVERLWDDATELCCESLPDWLDADTAETYRLLAAMPRECLSRGDRDALANAMLVVEDSGRDTRVYVPQPTSEAIFSIAVTRSESPIRPRIPPQPTLTRDAVTDAPAVYVADPFLVPERSGWVMFFEIFHWTHNKGEIAIAESVDGTSWHYGGVVLSEAFHLSYPLVFESGGEHYMLPESSQAGELRLYRAKSFPDGWEHVATLLEGNFLDPTPFRWHGVWWILTASGDPAADLRLYVSDNLFGPWREHPASPVVKDDPKRARPAGRILRYGARMIRIAQDCSRAYGQAVFGFDITDLDELCYSERLVPGGPLLGGGSDGWRSGGMHHLDAHRLPDGAWLTSQDGWSTTEVPMT